jgi:hypothetical protein
VASLGEAIRRYGPLEPWIDGCWKLDDLEPVDPS